MTRSALISLLLLAGLVFTSCGGASLDDLKTSAKAALASGDPVAALDAVDAGLKQAKVDGADKATIWSFEDLRLQALAKAGNADETVKELDRLAGDYGTQVTPALYTKLTSYVMETDLLAAVSVLDAGAKKFTDDKAAFEALAGSLATKATESGDTEAMAKLKELGYL